MPLIASAPDRVQRERREQLRALARSDKLLMTPGCETAIKAHQIWCPSHRPPIVDALLDEQSSLFGGERK
jgi:hypothetical protein